MAGLVTRFMTATICLLLAIVSAGVYLHDREQREPLQKFVSEFRFDVRRPEVAESVALTPTFDVGADLIGDYAIADAIVPAKLRDVTPEARQAWIEMPATIGKELDAARDLLLDSIASRPGWPYHQGILGQLIYTTDARVLSADLVRRSELWSVPMRAAASAASSDNRLWQILALSYLQTWPDLSAKHGQPGPAAFRRAFEDPAFVREAFGPALDILGTDRAVAALPDRALSLRHAFQTLAARGHVQDAWAVHQRWESAEWVERERDLRTIEYHARRGDDRIARALCVQWTYRHSVWDWDSKAGQMQAARLLDAWPAGAAGSWLNDRRSEIVRYFLTDRYASAPRTGIARATDSMNGVPLSVHAQALVVAGDVFRAESLDREAAEGSHLSRVPYLVQLARYELTRQGKERAAGVLARIPDVATEECAVRALRRDLSASADRPAETSSALTLQPGMDRIVCVESPRTVTVAVKSDRSDIVEVRRNGARVATLLALKGVTPWVRTPAVPGAQFISVRSHVPRNAVRSTS